MARIGPSTDYTDRDFDSLRARLFNLISQAFPEWDDTDSANFANLLVESFCFIGDTLAKYQDNQAREAFWGRVTQRANLLALCKLIGFKPRGNTASQVDLRLTLAAPPAANVVVPARSRFLTDAIVDPVAFETLTAVVFEAGNAGPLTVTAENAERREERFSSTGLPDLELRLAGSPFLDGSLEVQTMAGAYTVVDTFLDSTAASRHCTVTVNQEDRATVRFGNGVNGAVPSGPITVRYKVGGGADGRVEANKVRKVDGYYTDDTGVVVALTVINPNASTPASNRMGLEQIRAAGPESLRVQGRTVAKEDYEINARRVPGVARSLFLTAAQTSGIDENAGLLLVVPSGGGTPTQAMRDAVLEMVTVTYPNTLSFQVTVLGPGYTDVNVSAFIHLRAGLDAAGRALVRKEIQQALVEAFAVERTDEKGNLVPNEAVDFGFNLRGAPGEKGTVAWSDVFNLIRDVDGVRKVDSGPEGLLLNGERDDLELDDYAFPRLGTVTIYDASTGTVLALPEE